MENCETKERRFDGDDYCHERDFTRLEGQINDVFQAIKDGAFYTLGDIEEITGHPQASISAQLRNLRKERFGGFAIDKRHIKNGLYEYRMAGKSVAVRRKPQKRKIERMPADIDPCAGKTGLQVFDDVFYRNPHLKSTFSIAEITAIRIDLGAKHDPS